MPNSFSSIVGIKLELLTALNQSMKFFTLVLNKFAITKCVINIESWSYCFIIQQQTGHD